MMRGLILVVAFKNSSNLSAAYGIAVTGTMAITSLLFAGVARSRWNWSKLHVGIILVSFLVPSLSFLLANWGQISPVGWVPRAMALGVYVLMSTWKRGRMQLGEIQENN